MNEKQTKKSKHQATHISNTLLKEIQKRNAVHYFRFGFVGKCNICPFVFEVILAVS